MHCITSNYFSSWTFGFGPLCKIVSWNISMPVCLGIICGCFFPAMAELDSWDRTVFPQSLTYVLSESLWKICQPLYRALILLGEGVGIETCQYQLCFFRLTIFPATPPTQPDRPVLSLLHCVIILHWNVAISLLEWWDRRRWTAILEFSVSLFSG